MKREIGFFGIVAICILSGCQKMELDAPDSVPVQDDNAITFVVNQGKGWKNQGTKAGEPLVLNNEEGDELVLQAMTIDGICEAENSFEETKGAPISASNFSLYSGELTLKAMWDDSAFINDRLVLDGDVWNAQNGPYYWPASDVSLDFWAWAPSGTEYGTGTFKTPTISDGKISFTYGLQAHAEETAGSGIYNDAKHQPDLLYVRSSQHTKGSAIGLEFQHALAAVKFMIKTNSEGYVKSVSLLNVSSEGECIYTPGNSSAAGSFSWTDGNAPLSGTEGSVYTQSFDSDNIAAGASKVITEDEEGTVFMMIPQNLGIQKIRIVYHENKFNKDMVFTGTIPGDCWVSGKTYLYTLDYKTFSLSVSDKVTGNVKSDLVIRNTGSTPAFIRATLTGYWAKEGKNGKKIIVAPWDKSKGSFEGLAVKNWVKIGDHYYYKNAVPGATTVPDALFSSYTYSEEAPVAGAKLYIMVSAQAVEYDSAKSGVTEAWGAEIAANLNTL